ncbi:TetR/AcrR family transcriptional regulator [Myceligenerans pegani]|uniref:TetR/AcrR family transcriptional regulator n=1 Tax=Myceligenerans pegani TaxID=2776917 RepID=A0ABR9MS87_9MICO|nr:TetR/AcrR family transcriptional regulator [Myceligenerans sp. TRM 65318]MBE1874242.1 TetR/AcrR family transcriptional regulator [Myceligenerans sp. TRM 65318]MBE3016513.1 TetR/AcrR family transcriptional regulator [Myceligenerans sp. TRM 65318]
MTARTSADRGRAVRARLLAAARELVSEIGWNAVSTRNLAERAGVHAGLVHYHFESLPALLRQAATEAMRTTLDESATWLSRADDPADGVEALLNDLDRYAADDPASLLFVEAYLAATRDPVLRAEIAGLMLGLRHDLATALARAGHPAPEATAVVVLATFDGFMLHKGLDPELSAATIAPVLRRLAEAGAGVGSESAPPADVGPDPNEPKGEQR